MSGAKGIGLIRMINENWQRSRGWVIMENRKCCGTCRYGSYDKMQGYVCVNDDSEYCADFTEYDHVCDEWEGKGDEDS